MKYKFHLVYKITNHIDGRIYIGVHKTNRIDDSYMGSSKELKQDIKKLGINNFTKTILFNFNNSEEMFEKEARLVNRGFVNRRDTYNKSLGGLNTIEFVNENIDRFKPKNKRIQWAKKGRREANKVGAHLKGSQKHHFLLKNDSNYKNKYIKACSGRPGSFKGRKHKQSTKIKMRKAKLGLFNGQSNPNYGKKWMHNPHSKESKSIHKSNIKKMLSRGWILGRIL